MQLVQIGSFEGAGVSKSEEGADPLESEDAQPVRIGLGDDIGLVQRGLGRWRVAIAQTQEIEFGGAAEREQGYFGSGSLLAGAYLWRASSLAGAWEPSVDCFSTSLVSWSMARVEGDPASCKGGNESDRKWGEPWLGTNHFIIKFTAENMRGESSTVLLHPQPGEDSGQVRLITHGRLLTALVPDSRLIFIIPSLQNRHARPAPAGCFRIGGVFGFSTSAKTDPMAAE